MEQLQLLFSNEVLLEDARVMKLDYSITEKILEEDQKTPFYGVKITKYLDNRIETDEVIGISASRDVMISMIKRLCQFEVTPISMVEVIDDMITLGF